MKTESSLPNPADFMVLRSKLQIPEPAHPLIERARLYRLLDKGLYLKATCITSPAGYGKSTLASVWARRCGHPAGWLTLDEQDNEIRRFFLYLLSALDQHPVSMNHPLLAGILQSISVSPAKAATLLINEIQASQTGRILILDNFHLIRNKQIQDALAFLFAFMPCNLHLYLIGRSKPDFVPVSKVGRGDACFITSKDLRFTQDEERTFVRADNKTDRPGEETDFLLQQSEGWIAGLKLACIRKKDANPPSRAKTFAVTSHRSDS